jgi:lipoprotein NlpI
MGKKKRFIAKTIKAANQAVFVPPGKKGKISGLIFFVVSVTAVCFLPMLQNGFTNWDDEGYVTKNPLLKGPDWAGILTKPVVSNYHPLTIFTLAINYQLAPDEPFFYLLVNYLLHLLNTALVFHFIWLISGKKLSVAFLAALLFGIHPMHVESVAWISERKDVLYTFFFLWSAIRYWRFLETGRSSHRWICFLLFVLSLLSKPSAIVLPLILFLLDYWKQREAKWKLVIEKIPFLVMSVLFAVITLLIQSEKAVSGFDVFPLWTRLLFACYTTMIYFARFFFPHPLSAFQPFQSADNLGWPVLLSPVFILALIIFLWFQRRQRLIIFSFGFFIVNLLLVMHLVPVGYTIVSERYTYVPYIGLGFLAGMLLSKWLTGGKGLFVKAGLAAVFVLFCFISFQRTQVWKNSETLWTDAIRHQDAALPRTNRAYYYFTMADTMKSPGADSLLKKIIADCDAAVRINPFWTRAYETRGLVLIKLNRNKEALTDGDSIIVQAPDNAVGYSIRGTAHMRLSEFEKALHDFNIYLQMNPDDPVALNKRGTVYSNYYKKFNEAIADFSRAIELEPRGDFYLNRAYCYYMLGDLAKAKENIRASLAKGYAVPEQYRNLLNQ